MLPIRGFLSLTSNRVTGHHVIVIVVDSGILLHDSHWQLVILTGSALTEPLGLWCCTRRLPRRTAAKGHKPGLPLARWSRPIQGNFFIFSFFVDLRRCKSFWKLPSREARHAQKMSTCSAESKKREKCG